MSVTDEDRKRAVEVLSAIQTDAVWLTSARREPVDRIATALAEERERARAPFLALAETFDGYARSDANDARAARASDRDYWRASSFAWATAAAGVRETAEGLP